MSAIYSSRREEYARKKRNQLWLRIGLIFFCIVAFIALLSYGAHQSKIRISEIHLSGQVLVTQEDVEQETLSFVCGTYLWLFPKDNIFLYPKSKLLAHLKEHFKRIDDIHITRENYHTLSVEITERKPSALWCDTLPPQNLPADPGESAHCYFMDNNSTIFAEAPQFSGDAYFKYYGLLSTSTPIGAQYMASSTEFMEISSFVTTVQNLSVKPQYLLAQDNGEYALVLAGGAKLYFDMREPLSKTSENLSALLKSPVFAGAAHDGLPVEYIDLRFGNKLFYKLK